MGIPVGVDTALLGMSSAVETASTAAMSGVSAGVAPMITTVLPPGADVPSATAAAALNARGAATLAMLAELTAVRSLFASAIAVNGVSYAAVDAVGQSMLSV
jgi:hypothetical protein